MAVDINWKAIRPSKGVINWFFSVINSGGLPSVHVSSYAELRAYVGQEKSVAVSGYLGTSAPSGIAGIFARDDSDTSSADNGGTIIVASNGKRWKRTGTNGIYASKWFGAIADGTTHPLSERYASLAAAQAVYPFAQALTQEIDYCAIQAALNAAGVAGGGQVRLSLGSHYIGGATALLITYPNVELEGYGSASEIYIANWQTSSNPVANGHIVVAKTDGTPIKGVRISNLKIRGTKDYVADATWYGVAVPWNTIVFGNDSPETFDNCGVEYVTFENTGGSCVGAQAGTNDLSASAVVSRGLYVRHCHMDNGIFSGIDIFSGGLQGCDFSHNFIRRMSGGGILCSATGARIVGNWIELTLNYAVSAAGWASKTMPTLVANNVFFRCGKGQPSAPNAPSPTMHFGDQALTNFVHVMNNVVVQPYGTGIFCLGGGATDMLIAGNLIQELGYQASGKAMLAGADFVGIQCVSNKRIRIVNNVITAATGGSDQANYAIMNAGASEDCFTDDNVATGPWLQKAFLISSSAGRNGAGTRNICGRNNVDTYDGKRAEPHNNVNAAELPIAVDGDTTPDVSGADTILISNSAPTVITAFDGGTLGDVLKVVFQDAGNTTISDAGNFVINGVITSAANRTLTLLKTGAAEWTELTRCSN